MIKQSHYSSQLRQARNIKPMASAVGIAMGVAANFTHNLKDSSAKDGYVNAVLNEAGNHLDVYIIGIIGWESSHRGLINQLKEHDNLKTITVFINSVGGFIGEGLGMLNALRMHKAEVTTITVGYALSMGSILQRAASKGNIKMVANSMAMIHRAQGGSWGDAAELRKEAEILEKHEKALISEYKTALSLEESEVQSLLDAETWYTAEEALEAGLIDEVIEAADEQQADTQLSENVWLNLKESGLKNMPELVKTRMNTQLSPAALRAAVPSAIPSNASDDGSSSNPTEAQAQAIRVQALADDQQRRTDITNIFTAHGGIAGRFADTATAALDDQTCTLEQARENLLTALGEESPGAVGGYGNLQVTQDETDTRRDLMTNSLLARSNTVEAMPENPYAFMRLSDIAAACLATAGGTSAGVNPLNMVSNAFTQTSSDFPVILDRMITEMVLVSYRIKANTWKQWCAVGSVSDFREHKRLRLGSFGTLDEYTEGGEFKNKKIPDGEVEGVTIGTKGNIIAITREAIINDDLGYFSRMARMLGNAAGRTIESDVYKLLKSNPLMADGEKLFSAKHKNLMAGNNAAKMSEDVLNSMDLMMGAHKDISGNEELDISPELLLVPNTMKMVANKWMTSPILPGQDNSAITNGVAGLADVLSTARLSGTGYYLLAGANDVPTVEVNFLNGQQEPFLDNQTGWRTDGAEMKVRLDYGVDIVDYRGAVLNEGKA